MKLANFSVQNYRSITTAHKIQTHDMTVLVGKNNEGKSNILRALSLAMNIMQEYAIDSRSFRRYPRSVRKYYNWEQDYPLALQDRNPNGHSSIDLAFELSEQEFADIRELTGVRLASNILVRVSINNNDVNISIPKKGTLAFTNAENKQKVIEYVCNKINFNFIPAIRTEEDALRVVNSLIEDELETLDDNPEYVEAINVIDRLQQERLNQIANQIVVPLQAFLPTVRDIQIRIPGTRRRAALRRNTEVIVDDGTPTPIQQKGDGIKSLTALAMLNIATQTDRVSVIAIEEPESHLHPESAHQLYETILTLSKNHQIVLTTHSPLFVNRTNLKENIIVNGGKATAVKKVKEIRDVLGVKVSDNLLSAENILIVEGESDKVALEKLLPQMSDKIKKALQNGTLIIDYIGGSGNLPYKLKIYRDIQCKCHVLLDNDDAGIRAGQVAEDQGLLSARNVTYTICRGFPQAEIEDCYEVAAYVERIYDEFGVNLSVPEFRGRTKWSVRVENCFMTQGKQWGERIEKKVKFAVAEALPSDPGNALNAHKRTSIDALVEALNEQIG